jgi:hypothetical protein
LFSKSTHYIISRALFFITRLPAKLLRLKPATYFCLVFYYLAYLFLKTSLDGTGHAACKKRVEWMRLEPCNYLFIGALLEDKISLRKAGGGHGYITKKVLIPCKLDIKHFYTK